MITITIRPWALRPAFGFGAMAGLGALGWFIACTAAADILMTSVQRSPNLATAAQLAGADRAVRLAPLDPLLHWRRGGVYAAAATEDQADVRLTAAAAALRTAARLSPEDYRLWLALGRTLERGGAATEARAALERATQLAPNHFEPHWALGNHLLRGGEREAAFAELRAALTTRPAVLPLVFDYAWQAYGGDGRALVRALAAPSAAQPQLTALLIARGQVDEALALWRASSGHSVADTQTVARSLAAAGRYAAAFEIQRSAEPDAQPRPDDKSLLANGSFEQPLTFDAPLPFFAWRIAPSVGLRVALDDSTRAADKLSLRLGFDLTENKALLIAAQTVPVRPATAYRLSFAVKTEELQSLSTPFVEIFDAADAGRAHAGGEQLANGTSNWRKHELRLRTAATTEAVTIRIQRVPCAEPPCPLSGRIWLDDFKLN